ncbi:MAG TPA: hypothetical protein VLU46_04950 [Thermoanaerobaculia bacterium]|nr:hypothetical protein [Thermoanaerobaculia bacterium]
MRKLTLVALALVLASCATVSTTKPVNPSEPRRIVGTDNDVRVDAEIVGDMLQRSMTLPLRYDITNNRPAPIAVADMIPDTSYDADTGTVTIAIGTEVPGNMLLPRLIAIGPGEKKSFNTIVRLNLMVPLETPAIRTPHAVQVKLNFLGDTKTFEKLIGITEKGVYDPKLADELFPKWVERNETVFTNALPMRWGTAPPDALEPASRHGTGRGRG